MLLGKSKKLKIFSMLLIAATLSTSLISCQSSSKNTNSSDAKEVSETSNDNNEDNKKEEASETKNDSNTKTNSEANDESQSLDSETIDYHSAQAVDNANKTQSGFEISENVQSAPEGKVYILQGSTKYHSKSICGDLNKGKCIDKNIAETAGYSPCDKCYK